MKETLTTRSANVAGVHNDFTIREKKKRFRSGSSALALVLCRQQRKEVADFYRPNPTLSSFLPFKKRNELLSGSERKRERKRERQGK